MTETAARKWFGVLAPEDKQSGDKRGFRGGSLRMRSLPLPMTWQKVAGSGHDGNVVTGIIQEVWRQDGLIWGAGEYLDTPEADEHYNLVDKFGRYGISIDADDIDQFTLEMDDDGVTWFADARICAFCAVSIPAFAEAWMINGDYEDFARDFAGGWGAPSQQIPTRENEGQAECEHRDEDGNCIDRDDEERNYATQVGEAEDYLRVDHETGEVIGEASVPDEEEGEPCDCEDDPECVCDEDEQPEKELPFVSADAADAHLEEIEAELAERPGIGGYPIDDCSSLKDAIQAIGRARPEDRQKTIAHIRTQKKRLGCPEVTLPDSWAVEEPVEADPLSTMESFLAFCETWVPNANATIAMKDLAPGLTEDGPGWLTHPVDTDRLRDYWSYGEGAAIIGWGTPDDFYRCEAALAEYVKPQYLKGYCANRHYDALGFWPGQAPHSGVAMTASASENITVYMNGVEVGSEPTPIPALTASAPRTDPPRAWFEDPALPGVTPLTVTNEGHVFGHLATWGQCHIGFDGECVLLPKSVSDYSYFRIGVVDTDNGPVYTGALTMGGGHAAGRLGWRAAMEHYDTTSSVVADIAVGEDEHGVWMSGALREGVTDEQIRELKAAGKASGDWREVVRGSNQLELVAALTVNVGGFPVPRTQISADGGRVVSLTAAGIVEDDPIGDIALEVALRLEARQEMKALRAEVYGPEIAALREEITDGL